MASSRLYTAAVAGEFSASRKLVRHSSHMKNSSIKTLRAAMNGLVVWSESSWPGGGSGDLQIPYWLYILNNAKYIGRVPIALKNLPSRPSNADKRIQNLEPLQ